MLDDGISSFFLRGPGPRDALPSPTLTASHLGVGSDQCRSITGTFLTLSRFSPPHRWLIRFLYCYLKPTKRFHMLLPHVSVGSIVIKPKCPRACRTFMRGKNKRQWGSERPSAVKTSRSLFMPQWGAFMKKNVTTLWNSLILIPVLSIDTRYRGWVFYSWNTCQYQMYVYVCDNFVKFVLALQGNMWQSPCFRTGMGKLRH